MAKTQSDDTARGNANALNEAAALVLHWRVLGWLNGNNDDSMIESIARAAMISYHTGAIHAIDRVSPVVDGK